MTPIRKSMSSARAKLIGGLLAVIATATCAAAQSTPALEPVTLRLGWTYIGGFFPPLFRVGERFFPGRGQPAEEHGGEGERAPTAAPPRPPPPISPCPH